MGREYKNTIEALAADIAGDDYNTDTGLVSGWVGTVYYEKLSNDLLLATIQITTVGTTTDGTTVYTLPAGYRPVHNERILITSPLGTDGVGGYFEIGTGGAVKVYDFNVAVTSFFTTTATYMARN